MEQMTVLHAAVHHQRQQLRAHQHRQHRTGHAQRQHGLPGNEAPPHQIYEAQSQQRHTEQQSAAAAGKGQPRRLHRHTQQMGGLFQRQIKGHGQGSQQQRRGKVAVLEIEGGMYLQKFLPPRGVIQHHQTRHAHTQRAENGGEPPVQVVALGIGQARPQQHIENQHPTAETPGVVQTQRLKQLLHGQDPAAPQQGGRRHQQQPRGAASHPEGDGPDHQVPDQRRKERRRQHGTGEEIPQTLISLGRQQKYQQERRHRRQQIPAEHQQPNTDP